MSELNIRPFGHFITQPDGLTSSLDIASTGRSYIIEGSELYPDDHNRALVAFVDNVLDDGSGSRPRTRVILNRVDREPNEYAPSITDDDLKPAPPDWGPAGNELSIVPPILETEHVAAISGLVRTLEAIQSQSPQWQPRIEN